jgi:hypothetical protein
MTTSSTQQQSSQTSAPWAVQAPYLSQAFNQASTNLSNANGNTYSGQQVAQFTPDQLATFKSMIGSGNAGMAGANGATNAGYSAINSGTSALGAALSGLTNFNTTDPTQANIASATSYANNPATQGMIDAATLDAKRAVSENVLPQLARSDALSGNAMSSKDAITKGIIGRGLADTVANTSANIRGQQFQTGLNLAEQGRENNQNAMLSALTGAAGAGTSAINSGTNTASSGNAIIDALFNRANGGGAGEQQNTQNQIDNAKGMDEYANGTAAQNLQNFFNIIGSNQWGGTSNGTQTTQSTPSLWNTIGSGLGIASSLYKLSDRRLKTDVKCVGQADNGLPIYTFRYLNDPQRTLHMGLMAQDVLKVNPEAVSSVGGIYAVDYNAALG